MTTQAEALTTAPFALPHAPLAGITGGKGGVGKSTVAVNLAIALARGVRGGMAPKVLLVDCDLGLASLDALLTLPRGRNLGDAVDAGTNLADVIVRGPAGIEVLPAPRGVERFAELRTPERAAILRDIREAASSRDITILDLPAGIHPDGLTFAHAVDLSLVVTTPDPAALADAYAVVKLARDRAPHTKVGFLVNQVSGPAEARQVSEKLRTVAARFLGVNPEPFGWIPRDPAVTRSTLARKPVVLSEPGSPSAAAFRALAGRIAQALDGLASARSSAVLA